MRVPEQQGHWLPPQANHNDPAPFKDRGNIFLDDVVWEISILISQLPEEDRRQIQDFTNLPDADKNILRLLGAQDCACHKLAMG